MAFRSKSSCVCAMAMWKSSDSVLKGLDMVGGDLSDRAGGRIGLNVTLGSSGCAAGQTLVCTEQTRPFVDNPPNPSSLLYSSALFFSFSLARVAADYSYARTHHTLVSLAPSRSLPADSARSLPFAHPPRPPSPTLRHGSPAPGRLWTQALAPRSRIQQQQDADQVPLKARQVSSSSPSRPLRPSEPLCARRRPAANLQSTCPHAPGTTLSQTLSRPPEVYRRATN